MSRSSTLLLAALIGATLALPAAAQWKWKDRAGQVQYSDLPPPQGTQDKDILQRPTAASVSRGGPVAPAPSASAAPAPQLAPKGVEPELEAKKKQQEQAEVDKRKAEEQRVAGQRAENCTRARAQLRTLESGVRVSRTNEKGEREFIDDGQRAAEVKRARDVVASDCR